MGIQSYRDLEIWQKSMDLVVRCYQVATEFPQNESFGLVSQLQRAAVSIPANIAEGKSRLHVREFIQYLSIAYGSLAELETHIQIAERLHYLDRERASDLLSQTSEIGRMINGLRKSLAKCR